MSTGCLKQSLSGRDCKPMSATVVFAAVVSLFVTTGHLIGLATADERERPATNQPMFVSQGGHKWVKEGQDIELECDVRELGEFVILWKFNRSQVLFAGNLRIHRDDRISRDDRTGNLRIKDFRPELGGEYTCQISTNPPQDIVYSVALIGPPRIRAQPNSAQIVSVNQTFQLECEANADRIQWRKLEKDGSGGRLLAEEGPLLVVMGAQRTDAGTYECAAVNAIGQSHHRFSVQVFYAPEVRVREPVVHAPIGQSVQIACIVYAEPSANVHWFARNVKVLPNDNFQFGRDNRTATLTIANVTPDHYDNYSCVANNSFGTALSTIQVTGRPSRAHFTSPVLAGHGTSYDIEWTVDSEAPITAYELRLRRLTTVGDGTADQWRRLEVMPTDSSGPTRRQRFRIDGLELDGNYEVDVLAQNRFGATRSDIFSFVTSWAVGVSSGLWLIVAAVCVSGWGRNP